MNLTKVEFLYWILDINEINVKSIINNLGAELTCGCNFVARLSPKKEATESDSVMLPCV